MSNVDLRAQIAAVQQLLQPHADTLVAECSWYSGDADPCVHEYEVHVAADCPAARHLQDLSMEDVRSAVWAYFAGMDLSDTGEALQDLTYDIAAAVLAETIAPGQEATFAFDLRTGAYNVWARPFGGEAWEQVVGELFNPPTNLLDALRLTLN